MLPEAGSKTSVDNLWVATRSIFRSEDMALCQIFIQIESAYYCLAELGELGVVQFKDLNTSVNLFQRRFVKEMSKYIDLERRMRYIENEIRKENLYIPSTFERPPAPAPRDLVDLVATITKTEKDLKLINENAFSLKQNYLQMIQYRHVLIKGEQFLDEIMAGVSRDSRAESRINIYLNLNFVTGVINRDKLLIFERIMWRSSRGNIISRNAPIDEPIEEPSGEIVLKSVFIVFFQGEELKNVIMKICDGYRATTYPSADTPEERKEILSEMNQRLTDFNIILGQTKAHQHRALLTAAKNMGVWHIKVQKIKAIYGVMNNLALDVTQKCLIAECWVPYNEIKTIKRALKSASVISGSALLPIFNIMDTAEEPPTYNALNDFTQGFQNLINSYGVGDYKEINPTPFTVISFPFLFALMFGDMGHGLIMTLFGAWMICKSSVYKHVPKNEIYSIFFSGRYIIFLMGFFSTYTGFIYNDFFSKSINIFGSSWMVSKQTKKDIGNGQEWLMLDPTVDYIGEPYTIGIDPVWNMAKNKIIFLNSFKMKASIIMGVCHMLFGVILSFFNHIYFKNYINIFCEFIPQVLFLCCLFVYMVILFFIKWFTYYATNDPKDFESSESCAPSILITFINMILHKSVDHEHGCKTSEMYNGQEMVQPVLLLIALICIPWMLLVKPIILLVRKKRRPPIVMTDSESDFTTRREKKHESTEEIFIHQIIHTIEYVLGSVSHTASYLRLWALSLAHAQLSEVLWGRIFIMSFKLDGYYGGILVFFVFMIWASLTIAILVLMEGLSAFLHTLRLHWVEFQSKFYAGTGHAFQPFTFKTIVFLPN